MAANVDISKAKVEYLDLISDTEAKEVLGKGWSLPFVYSFREIRDVYLAFCKYGQTGTLAEFSKNHVVGMIPPEHTRWDDKGRRVLEIKNALINFGFLDKETRYCKKGVFEEIEPGSSLTDADLNVFRDVFFHYFRFQEYCSLFVNPRMTTAEKQALTQDQIIKESGVLFYYGSAGTRVDSFFYSLKNPETLFKLPLNDKGKVKGGFVRFWDMFLSWTGQLGLVERLNMKRQGYLLSNEKAFSAAYFINPYCAVDVPAVLDDKFHRQLLIDISDLVMEICLRFRCSINGAQQAVIDYYQAHTEVVSLIRTSEIFIKETELNKNDRLLYPKYKGSFVSHLKLRKNGQEGV